MEVGDKVVLYYNSDAIYEGSLYYKSGTVGEIVEVRTSHYVVRLKTGVVEQFQKRHCVRYTGEHQFSQVAIYSWFSSMKFYFDIDETLSSINKFNYTNERIVGDEHLIDVITPKGIITMNINSIFFSLRFRMI